MKNFTKIIFVVIATVFLSSCDNDDVNNSFACDVVNPAENLPWLRTMIESWEATSTIYTYMYVQQGTYSGNTVFIAANCCPFCDSYFPVFNCAGEELDGINIQEITDLKTVWKPLFSQCNL